MERTFVSLILFHFLSYFDTQTVSSDIYSKREGRNTFKIQQVKTKETLKLHVHTTETMTPNIRQRRQTKKKKKAKSLPYDSNLPESKTSSVISTFS